MHTINSKDAHTRPEQIVPLAKRVGLDGIAITDHNVLGSATSGEILIIPGIEVSTRDGHVIGLGVSSHIPRGLPADETIEKIRDNGGVSIIPHPYDFLRSSVNPERLVSMPDAIEVINSASFLHSVTWKRANRFAQLRGLPRTAGSDSHIPETLGRAFTIVEADRLDASAVLEAVRNGLTMPEGDPITFSQRMRKIFR